MKSIAAFVGALALIGPRLMAGPPPTPTKADVSYGPDAHQIMDICVPPKGDGPFPVVLFYGGIWKSDKHVPDLNRFFPGHCAVIAVETRGMGDAGNAKISPPISVVLLDARRAVQFVRLHAAEWNLDPRRIAVAGGSQAAIPALYVACEGEQANPQSSDPVERMSTKVVCAGSYRGPGSIDPKRLLEWDPGDAWGAPSLGCSFAESLKNRDQLLPLINQWSPDALLTRDAPPIYIQYDWGLTKPDDITEDNYRIHSPLLALGFQKLAQERGATCYVKFPGHDSEKYKDMWDFLVQQLNPAPVQP
jgi:dienelactone hydrolase